MEIASPYQYFGGKRRIAALAWERCGDCPNYVEPFFGSGAVLINRPHYPWSGNRIETVNDLHGFIPNFWRAIQAAPDEVAKWTDWPVSELDLHARHLWLVTEGRKQIETLRTDPEFFDVKIAGWWVWGLCQWIGAGWCSGRPSQQRPHLGDAGRGVHRPSQQLPHLGDAGRGVHRPSQQRPHLGDAGQGVHRPGSDLPEYFRLISARLRGVRVCCGNWKRVCGPAPTFKHGMTAVFLDPPYSHSERDENLYAEDHDVSRDVREWCLENGGNKLLRIALCGYAGEGHDDMVDHGWECVAWKAAGGYANQGEDGQENAARERIWFSPNCLHPEGLFKGIE
jgi:DNA adenine methylase